MTDVKTVEGSTDHHPQNYKGGDEDEETEDYGHPNDDEYKSLLHQSYIPCSPSGANLQLSIGLRTYEGFTERFQSPIQYNNLSSNSNMPTPSHGRLIALAPQTMSHQGSLVAVRLSEDLEDSSSSPFHSAAEDFQEADFRTRDRDPLLVRGPVKKGTFHQFLTNHRTNNNEEKPNGGLKQHEDEIDTPTRRPMICSFGILLAAISCIFFATSALIVKVSVLHPMELLAVRGIIQWLLVAPIVISSGNSFFGPPGSRSLLLARAILGSVALIMSFISIHLIPLADAATVIFTSPVFVSIFACVCLGELCSWFDVAMIILTLMGVLLVSKPSFGFISSGSWEGIAGTSSGLAASMLTAMAFIVLRQLKHVHYAVTVLWFSTVLASFGAVLTVALNGFTLPTQWVSIVECVAIGVCGFFGQVLLTKALQIENAGPVAVARTLDIVLAFFYQITLLHDTPDWYSYLGSLLVVSCVLLTALRRWYDEVQALKTDKPNMVGASQNSA